MLFRGRQAASVVWQRFRPAVDEFTFAERDGHTEARVAASAERVVDLLGVLAEQLPPAVDVRLRDVRTGRRWSGHEVALPDVREAVARLKVPLAAYGGVELDVFTDEDQLALTPDLVLYVYARTDRWLYLLQGKGLVEATRPPLETIPLRPEEYGDAPELSAMLAALAERLGLIEERRAGPAAP